ncbi:MAG: hypothetical protein ABUK01_05700 [Leptospirales bacterium]
MFRITINLVIAVLCFSAFLTFLLPWHENREMARLYLQEGQTTSAVIIDKTTVKKQGWLPEASQNSLNLQFSDFNFLIRFKLDKKVYVYPITEYVTQEQYSSLKPNDLVEIIYLPETLSVNDGKILFTDHVFFVDSIKQIPTENWSGYWRIYPAWSFAGLCVIFIIAAFIPVRKRKEKSTEILVET